MSACVKCDGGKCIRCRQAARVFRLALRRAVAQPGFAKLLLTTGEERAESGAVLAGGLPDSDNPDLQESAQRLLFRLANAVKHS